MAVGNGKDYHSRYKVCCLGTQVGMVPGGYAVPPPGLSRCRGHVGSVAPLCLHGCHAIGLQWPRPLLRGRCCCRFASSI